MKKFINALAINGLSLALIGWLFAGVTVSFAVKDFFFSCLLLTIIFLILQPVFELILLPLNLLTLGLFRWLKIVISFAITVYFAPGIDINSFNFAGFDLRGIKIDSFEVTKLMSLIFSSLLLHFLQDWLPKIFKTK